MEASNWPQLYPHEFEEIQKFDETFLVMKGSDLRAQFGVNQWMQQAKVVTSLDLAKREDILPGLRQTHWDLVIVDDAEQRFREGAVQVLVATEAAGEGINLQVCNVLFNYDIPWNPNRLEQRMGASTATGRRRTA